MSLERDHKRKPSPWVRIFRQYGIEPEFRLRHSTFNWKSVVNADWTARHTMKMGRFVTTIPGCNVARERWYEAPREEIREAASCLWWWDHGAFLAWDEQRIGTLHSTSALIVAMVLYHQNIAMTFNGRLGAFQEAPVDLALWPDLDSIKYRRLSDVASLMLQGINRGRPPAERLKLFGRTEYTQV